MILAIDIGTTVLKAALLGEAGRIVSLAVRRLCSSVPSPGHHEADPDEWMSAIASVSTELLSRVSETPRALVVSGNGPTLVPVDIGGSFLKPVMSWMDRRGTVQSDRIASVNDFRIDPSFYLPKALWISDNLPEVYDKTAWFLSCPESVVFRLTGEAVTILPGLHFEKYFWSPELIRRLGLDKSKFPDFVKPGHITGRITAKGASESNLPQGIPVISAGPDFVVSLLGTGAVYPGRACDRCGTSEGINLCTEKYITDPRLMGYGHVIEPWFNVSGIISTSGKALEWIKQTAFETDSGIEAVVREAESSTAGAGRLVFLPYLSGERAPHWDPFARGAFIGLGLQHRRGDLVRAVLESTGFAIRDVISVMEENDSVVEELRITGRPAVNPMWNQIKADISGRRLLVPESFESELLGDLAVALKALGETDNLAETADRIVRITGEYIPDSGKRQLYDDLFGIYRESYTSLKDIFKKLSVK